MIVENDKKESSQEKSDFVENQSQSINFNRKQDSFNDLSISLGSDENDNKIIDSKSLGNIDSFKG